MSLVAVHHAEHSHVFDLPRGREWEQPAFEGFSRQIQRKLQYEVRSRAAHGRRGAATGRLCVLSHPLVAARRGAVDSSGTLRSQRLLRLPHSERAIERTRYRLVRRLPRSEILRQDAGRFAGLSAGVQSRATQRAATPQLQRLSPLHRGITATAPGKFSARTAANGSALDSQ